MDQPFGMVWIDLERPAQASFGRAPIPLTQKQNDAERRLRIGVFAFHRKRFQGGSLGFGIGLKLRNCAHAGLSTPRHRQAGMRRRVHGVDLNSRLKTRDGIGQLKIRRGEQVRTTASNEFKEFNGARRRAQRFIILRCAVSDLRDKPIASPRNRLDISAISCAVSKRLAQRRDMHRQDSFFNERLRPNARQQFLFGHQSPLPTDQGDEYVVRFWSQPYWFGSAQQPPVSDVESELAKTKDFLVAHDVSANLSKTFGTPLVDSVYVEFISRKEIAYGEHDRAGDSPM